ncbi:MAG: Bax inhibitor-1/YccA family protein [Acidobacteria bacterium]|nr:Bax inhibitor-1/YccA family protein [Acidobacteriota bacterium]MBK8813045.1 Bax inhibitor-1/YccA family protein [Acidobacteriota bacterium]
MEQEFNQSYGYSAADAKPAERASFIRKTYLHLAAAILAFVGVEAFFFVSGVADMVIGVLQMGGRLSWFAVLAAFMGVSWLANKWAHSEVSGATQYLGLIVYIVAEALIFIPLLYMAAYYGGGADTILKAGLVTFGLFAGLTAVVFITRVDFSFLGSILAIGGFVALGFIAASLIFGFTLGTVFAFVMVAFAATAILYSTSNVLHSYHPTQHVAASLSLFASVALLFWYILTIFSSDD